MFDKDEHIEVIHKQLWLVLHAQQQVRVEDIEELVEYVEGEVTNKNLVQLKAQEHLE